MEEDRDESPLVSPPATSPATVRQLKMLFFFIGSGILLLICLWLADELQIRIPMALALAAFLVVEVVGWLLLGR